MNEATRYYGGGALSEGSSYILVVLKSFKSCFGVYILEKNAVITALATFVMAWFTGTIWTISRSQLSHARQVERAYVSTSLIIEWEDADIAEPKKTDPGVPMVTVKEPRWLVIGVGNQGKTPAVVTKIAHGICNENELPKVSALPREYKKSEIFVDIALGPGQNVQTKIRHDFASCRGMIVYGRVYYTDIFKKAHSSGFIAKVMSDDFSQVEAAPPFSSWD